MLDPDTNYLVSGLERSGTSLMMRMLHLGGVPVAFDDSRAADDHNPKGYYELAGGKIISRLMDGSFDLLPHRGKVLKVTAYGLKLLPVGRYRIIYMQRPLEEVLRSMAKMGADISPETDGPLFQRVNRFALSLIEQRDDMECLTVGFRDALGDAAGTVDALNRFLGIELDRAAAGKAVDRSLYRNRGPA